MLIKCTECGHDVSEFADRCPNCRCPIDIILKNTISDEKYIEDSPEAVFCNINGKKTDITWLKEIIDKLSKEELYHYKYVWSQDVKGLDEILACSHKYSGTPEEVFCDAARKLYLQVREKCDLEYKVARRFLYELVESDFELKEFYGESQTEAVEKNRQRLASMVKCPYCGSIDVKKIFFGGFAQKQWHCNNCRSDF